MAGMKLVAEETHTFMVSETELAKLIAQSSKFVLHVSFGPHGAWLTWKKGTQLPSDVEALANLRGVSIQ